MKVSMITTFLLLSFLLGKNLIGFKFNNEIYYKIDPITGERVKESDKGSTLKDGFSKDACAKGEELKDTR